MRKAGAEATAAETLMSAMLQCYVPGNTRSCLKVWRKRIELKEKSLLTTIHRSSKKLLIRDFTTSFENLLETKA